MKTEVPACLCQTAFLIMLGLAIGSCAPWIRDYIPNTTLVPPAEYVLPTRDCGSLFLVDALLDGRGPYALIVDTGVYGLRLTPRAGKELQSNGDGPRRVRSLRVGEFEARDVGYDTEDLSRFAEAMGTGIDGILGFSVFKEILLTFDYPSRQVRVSRGQLIEDEWTVRFTYDDHWHPTVRYRVGGQRGRIMIDTGAMSGVMLGSVDEILFERPPRPVGMGLTLSGRYEVLAGRAANSGRVGPIEMVRPMIVHRPGPSLIGAKALAGFTVTFDQVRRRVRFEPAAEGSLKMEPLRSLAVGLILRSDAWEVASVFEGSPAARAGLDIGDRIVRVNSTAIAGSGCDRFRLLGGESDTAHLTIDRGGTTMEIAVPLTLVE